MAETYSVYFDSGSGMELIESGITDTELTIAFGPFEYYTGYSWRVDATNEYGTTTGDTWTFTSIKYDPPLPSGITLNDDGVPTGTPTGENNIVTIRRLVVAANNKIWYEAI